MITLKKLRKEKKEKKDLPLPPHLVFCLLTADFPYLVSANAITSRIVIISFNKWMDNHLLTWCG